MNNACLRDGVEGEELDGAAVWLAHTVHDLPSRDERALVLVDILLRATE